MDLSLNDDQRMICDAADAFLADVGDSAAVRKAAASDLGYDRTVWQRIGAELGWCGIGIAEEHGGLGLGPVELVLVQEQIGRRLLPSPFFATVCLAANLLQAVGNAAAVALWLPQIAAGQVKLSVPLASDADAWRAAAAQVTATQTADGWHLQGAAKHLPQAQGVDAWLVPAHVAAGDEIALFLVPSDAAGVNTLTRRGYDQTRRFSRVETDCRVPAVARVDDPQRTAGWNRALARARLYLAAEQLGAASRCLELTVDYVANRKQFGRPVGGFQAVKHRAAQMMVQVETTRSVVYGAAHALAVGGAAAEAATAVAWAKDALFFCAAEAIQLHGGVGFTWEYDPQLYFKRAQASSHWLGTSAALRAEVAGRVIGPVLQPGEAVQGFISMTTDVPSASSASCADGVCYVAPASTAPAPVLSSTQASPVVHESAADAAFRAAVAEWMDQHLTGKFEPLRFRGGPGDEEADPALRKDWERELATGGWTCVGWPRQAGGRGLPIGQQVIFYEEYARAGGPGRMGHIGVGLIGPALIRFGTEAQKREFLPGIVAGTTFWAQGYSEPNAGSDLANVQTRAEQQADGSWRVTGQKIWTSLAHESDWIFVLARCEAGSHGSHGLVFLLMPIHQPGIEVRPIRQMGGDAEFNEVFFDGAMARAEHVIGEPGQGWKVAMGLLEAERGVSTLGQQMHFQRELDLVIAAARRTGQLDDAVIRDRIAHAWMGLRVMRYNAERMLSGESTALRREALIAKYYWSNWHRDLGKLAADVLGPLADVASEDEAIRPLQQLFFFSRADTIYAGTNEIQLNLISERGLGLPRELRPAARATAA